MHPANAIELTRTDHLDRADARRLQRRRASGKLERVRHGVYVNADAWSALDARSRHLVRMRAALPDLPTGAVFSHDSAAAVLGIPRLDSWPARVHAMVPDVVEPVHRVGLTLHPGPAAAAAGTALFHGVLVTGLAVTATELARRMDFAGAVVALDHAARNGVAIDDLRGLLAEAPRWGVARAVRALDVCHPAHESVGESFAAARFRQLRTPAIVPQHVFDLPDGSTVRVDFWMPELGVVIEFDGRQKYEDPAMLRGRSGADALWAEKRREDQIRRLPGVRAVIRVTWWHLVDPERLRVLFREHGVPCR